ncbi:SRPBCC family protein [Pseudooceanicola sp. LIPI14-2-Ac024]|uniref:SRPBCC family protein n=1 Tax=Pseudooceanicola sp. LIPI14-2-Ac024 TaxID=3344875 RepID=UPI0035CFD3A8
MTIEKTEFVYVTYIRATPEKVFAAITTPEMTARYWGHDNVSDWKVGSDWQHIRANEGREVNLVGKVVEVDAPRRLVLSWANHSERDRPEKYSRVTFEITPFEDMVQLTVTHDELEKGSGMEAGITRGWPRVLSSLKSFLETGEPIDIFASPKAA